MTSVATGQATKASWLRSPFVPPAVTLAVTGAAVAYIATHNPHTQQVSGPCILFATTGIYCPGCGGTRAVYDLAHGDIAGAVHMNAFFTLFMAPLAAIGFGWWVLSLAGVKLPAFNPPTRVVWTYVALLGVFWIARNIPGLDFLHP